MKTVIIFNYFFLHISGQDTFFYSIFP